ncbi:MAG: hypothetical protein ABIH46_09065, partial [Chloroflexota bacterium]
MPEGRDGNLDKGSSDKMNYGCLGLLVCHRQTLGFAVWRGKQWNSLGGDAIPQNSTNEVRYLYPCDIMFEEDCVREVVEWKRS